MTPPSLNAPFQIVRILYAPDGDGKRELGRERADAAPDLSGAHARLHQFRAGDSDAIADGLLDYEVHDGQPQQFGWV